jgi:Peptidase C13 family
LLSSPSGVPAIRRDSTPLRALASLVVALLVLVCSHAADAQQQQQQQRRGPRIDPRIDYEAVMYAQPRLIDEVMAHILPTEKSEPSTYFLGFAGWAEQNVFIREVSQARDIVDERLATSGRSLLLVNHPTALHEVPLATVTNLEIVLRRLGRIMNPQKDTLILFLTSHGIENLFAVQFPGFPLNHLTPQRLIQALDRSGIENRIVIISACHSGSFIPALSRPKTLVLTAARADRTSFGCANGRDWTYFGDALFNNALREEKDLVKAFHKANALIAQWEVWRRLLMQQPSEPQISVGSSIGKTLAAISRLDGEKRAEIVPSAR